jgi:hypothetical protein
VNHSKLLEYIIIIYILISIIIYITKYISRSIIRVLLVITKDRVSYLIPYVNYYWYMFVI